MSAGRRLALRATAFQAGATALTTLAFLVQGAGFALAALVGGFAVVAGGGLAALVSLGGGVQPAGTVIGRMLAGVIAQPRYRSTPPQTGSSSGPAVLGPRSGNLRVKREFSDHDKAQFQQDAFDFITRYFDNSLTELSGRHAHIQGDFQRIDTHTFHAILYLHGKQVSACAVRLARGGMIGNGIRYSSELGRSNSFNEVLTVEHDDQSLFLRSMGGSKEPLTCEGGAELFWSMLIRPIQ